MEVTVNKINGYSDYEKGDLVEYHNGGAILLVCDISNSQFDGIVLRSSNSAWKIGDYKDDLEIKHYNKFRGEIKLTQ